MRLLWSRKTASPLRGLCLARERGWLLAWDGQSWLHLFNSLGESQGRFQTPVPLAAACCSDDGSAHAAVGVDGDVWFLGPDLLPRWHKSIGARGVALALEAFGNYLAVVDASGKVHLFDREGKVIWVATVPRALHHLTFLLEQPLLIGAADFGLIMAMDGAGQFVWREGVVVNVGSLAVDASGNWITLACFGESLLCWDATGKRHPPPPGLPPCRLAAVSQDGMYFLLAGLDHRLTLHDKQGAVVAQYVLDHALSALVLTPFADSAYVGLPEGKVLALSLPTRTQGNRKRGERG